MKLYRFPASFNRRVLRLRDTSCAFELRCLSSQRVLPSFFLSFLPPSLSHTTRYRKHGERKSPRVHRKQPLLCTEPIH